MTNETGPYLPTSEAGKFAMKSGVLLSAFGAFLAIEQTIVLGAEALTSRAMAETATNMVEAIGFSAVSFIFAAKAPRHIDNFTNRISE
jgi:hypothetical protein